MRGACFHVERGWGAATCERVEEEEEDGGGGGGGRRRIYGDK